MAPTKRLSEGEAPQRKANNKKPRRVNLVPVVVEALEDAEALPADLRTVFKVALPTVFSANKADRHTYEAEVVEQAEQALATVQAALEKAHGAALTKQNEVIAPEEHAARTAAKKEAEASSEAVKVKLEATREAQAALRKAVQDAEKDLKAAEKDAGKLEKESQAHADKKTGLSELLGSEYVTLKDGTSHSPEGKKAVKKLMASGKEYGLDPTMLQTLPVTCKKEPANRSEFEVMMFDSLKSAIDKKIEALAQTAAEMEPSKAQRLTAVAEAKAAVERAEAAQSAASEELSTTQAANKDALKEVAKADEYLYKVWRDMKEACDAQDELAGEVKNFKDNIWTAFQQLKEKEPEPDPVDEPEEVEMEAPAEEAAAVEGEAAAPTEA